MPEIFDSACETGTDGHQTSSSFAKTKNKDLQAQNQIIETQVTFGYQTGLFLVIAAYKDFGKHYLNTRKSITVLIHF